MMTEPSPKVPVDAINWARLVPNYPYRFKGPAYLYCVACVHFICMALFSKRKVSCLECGRVLGSVDPRVC